MAIFKQSLSGPIPRAVFFTVLIFTLGLVQAPAQSRQTISFDKDWQFYLGAAEGAEQKNFNDHSWRTLDLPHDWSIELPFDKDSPTGTGGGALRGGLGWYRKSFTVPDADRTKKIFIDFDGVYCNSEVFINGHSLGKRPNGYISFRYELTPWLKFGGEKNVITVKVDNSQQPNSRWYSGSGIYRHVRLVTVNPAHIGQWGTQITTIVESIAMARVNIRTNIVSGTMQAPIMIKHMIYDNQNRLVGSGVDEPASHGMEIKLTSPHLWSVDSPHLYTAITQLIAQGIVQDEYKTVFGIRHFSFDPDKGFLLNGKHLKIRGVCNHHDLGCLGTAINKTALRRQLQILKAMGCNGIRTSHNPPAPELLDLCDEMGFIVMDEAFDMWKQSKTTYDYHLNWEAWHRKDLEDQIRRDRNHPSVFIWSLGNEIPAQWAKEEDTSGTKTLRELQAIVQNLDPTRPTVTANNEIGRRNQLLQSGITDLIGYNYNHQHWDSVYYRRERKPFIITESVSGLQTRGHYDLPADSIRRWPIRWDLPLTTGNPDFTCSAYDNCAAPWGSTHEETLREFERYDHISGMYVWTGFDYIGEPTPYPWPARSSYFGIIDLAGFPKDIYYMYQSVWTNQPVLHVLPHWNWKPGQLVDVWAYYNQADEVELFLNGQSLGIQHKKEDQFHIQWRVPFQAGILKAISRKNGKTVLIKEVRTAGPPAKLLVETDRNTIDGQQDDLAFITVKIVDRDGNLVPDANNEISFAVQGGTIAGTDNGNQTSLESFQSPLRHAFNGLCLAVVRPSAKTGVLTLTANTNGLRPATIRINCNM